MRKMSFLHEDHLGNWFAQKYGNNKQSPQLMENQSSSVADLLEKRRDNMLLKWTSIPITMLVLIGLFSCRYVGEQSTVLTDDDITELMRLTIEEVSENKNTYASIYSMIYGMKEVIISTERIKRNMLPKISGTNLLAMSPQAIKERADSIGPFLYLHFRYSRIENDAVFVELIISWATIEGFEMMQYFSGDGIAIVFHRRKEKWLPVEIQTIETHYRTGKS
jgi:hypothetical protein